jgi:hypothetical protein
VQNFTRLVAEIVMQLSRRHASSRRTSATPPAVSLLRAPRRRLRGRLWHRFMPVATFDAAATLDHGAATVAATARRLGAATETAAAVSSEAKPRACGRIDARFGRDEQTAGGKAEGGPQAAFEGRRNIPEYNRMVLSEAQKSDEGQTGSPEAAGRARDR